MSVTSDKVIDFIKLLKLVAFILMETNIKFQLDITYIIIKNNNFSHPN